MITDEEFSAILSDPTKRVDGDIRWIDDEDKSSAMEFMVDVWSEPDWPLIAHGWFNPQSGKLSYSVIVRGWRRIIGLDLGEALVHHNLGCRRRRDRVRCTCPRGMHKQYWSEQHQMGKAFVPGDITASWDDPVTAWREFCAEIHLEHVGRMWTPEWQDELL